MPVAFWQATGLLILWYLAALCMVGAVYCMFRESP